MNTTETTTYVAIAATRESGLYPETGIDILVPETETSAAEWVAWIPAGRTGDELDEMTPKALRRFLDDLAYAAGWQIDFDGESADTAEYVTYPATPKA